MVKDDTDKNISSVKVNISTFKELKKMSIDKDVSVSQIAKEVLERAMNKKTRNDDRGVVGE